MNSVLQEWVMELPLRAQGTLLTGIRGCDLTPKLPLDAPERKLVGFIRFCVMNPADPREVDIKGAFFQSNLPYFKPSEFGHYPLHWFSHVMHCMEVIGYCHPEWHIRRISEEVYLRMVHSLHLYPETREQMITRLTENRLKNNTVVS